MTDSSLYLTVFGFTTAVLLVVITGLRVFSVWSKAEATRRLSYQQAQELAAELAENEKNSLKG